MTEIERKFLVRSEAYKEESFRHDKILQGYLNSHSERTVRIRTKGEKGYITVKGKSSENGLSRFEWEKEIPYSEAEELILLCEPGVISKIRYLVNFGGHTFEVDEFNGDNEGLTIAEIELDDEDSDFQKPGWLGEEVTGSQKYYNSQLISHPYKNWT